MCDLSSPDQKVTALKWLEQILVRYLNIVLPEYTGFEK